MSASVRGGLWGSADRQRQRCSKQRAELAGRLLGRRLTRVMHRRDRPACRTSARSLATASESMHEVCSGAGVVERCCAHTLHGSTTRRYRSASDTAAPSHCTMACKASEGPCVGMPSWKVPGTRSPLSSAVKGSTTRGGEGSGGLGGGGGGGEGSGGRGGAGIRQD